MKVIPTHIVVCLLSISIACVAHGQSPAFFSTPAPATGQEATPAPKEQTLSKQVATDCWNTRRLAIRAVNLKYIALTQDAAALFTKENNQPRADDANTWAKNLAWANDANLKGIAPDAKDRLGVLQAAYMKERVNAIITADTACVAGVEAASKQAAQTGDQASVTELAKQEDRIKQELRAVNAPGAQPPPAARPNNTPRVAAAPPAAHPAGSPAATPAPQSQPASHPFGVQANQLEQVATPAPSP